MAKGTTFCVAPFVCTGEEGIEPPLTVLETAALPLYYSPIYGRYLTDKGHYNTGVVSLARVKSKKIDFSHFFLYDGYILVTG